MTSTVRVNISDGNLSAKDVTCMAITNQRNTFITWDRYVINQLINQSINQSIMGSISIKDLRNHELPLLTILCLLSLSSIISFCPVFDVSKIQGFLGVLRPLMPSTVPFSTTC